MSESDRQQRPGADKTEKPRGGARPKLRDQVVELDRDIIRLLLRRHNMLRRMAGEKGRLSGEEEKFLRQSWEANVSRYSRDSRLSRQFFTLMQELDFMPAPQDGAGEQKSHRIAFNLAPPRRPVRIDMEAPLDSRSTRAMLMLAAASGQPLRLSPCLMNDAEVDCLKALDQLGAALTRGDGGVMEAVAAAPAQAPDKVLHVGDSSWNFFLLLAHYLGRPSSRARISGGSELKLASFAATRRFLGALNARLTPVVPGSDGLPARVECAGLLPAAISFPAEVPIELAEAMALAAPFYDAPLRLDLAAHPDFGLLCERTLPILRACGARASLAGATLELAPGALRLPWQPDLPLDTDLGAFLLAFPAALGGRTRLGGRWPDSARAPLKLLAALGLRLETGESQVILEAKSPVDQARLDMLPDGLAREIGARWLPLSLAVAGGVALERGEALLPPIWREELPAASQDVAHDFLGAIGLVWREDGRLESLEESDAPRPLFWTAPDPAWALAYALAACRRPQSRGQGFALGNPGVMTGLYPAFWSLYNGLPEPASKKPVKEAPAPVRRRRVRTTAEAVLPELREED